MSSSSSSSRRRAGSASYTFRIEKPGPPPPRQPRQPQLSSGSKKHPRLAKRPVPVCHIIVVVPEPEPAAMQAIRDTVASAAPQLVFEIHGSPGSTIDQCINLHNRLYDQENHVPLHGLFVVVQEIPASNKGVLVVNSGPSVIGSDALRASPFDAGKLITYVQDRAEVWLETRYKTDFPFTIINPRRGFFLVYDICGPYGRSVHSDERETRRMNEGCATRNVQGTQAEQVMEGLRGRDFRDGDFFEVRQVSETDMAAIARLHHMAYATTTNPTHHPNIFLILQSSLNVPVVHTRDGAFAHFTARPERATEACYKLFTEQWTWLEAGSKVALPLEPAGSGRFLVASRG